MNKMIIVENWLIKRYKDGHYYYNILEGFNMKWPRFRKTNKKFLLGTRILAESEQFNEFMNMEVEDEYSANESNKEDDDE